jgi:hypothetical protein
MDHPEGRLCQLQRSEIGEPTAGLKTGKFEVWVKRWWAGTSG